MTRPMCGQCGLEMTPENSKIHPEYFLHDACLPDELKPPITKHDPRTCPHNSFDCNVAVARVEDIGRFMAEVAVRCVDCGTPFRFIGLPCGMDYNVACVSVDGTEARLAIAPKGEVVTPLDGVTGFTARRTK